MDVPLQGASLRVREIDDRGDLALRRAIKLVAALNLGYFGIEFAVALAIGSVSLFADSVDFLEDTSVNLLILAALGWSPRARARVGMALAGVLLVPALATLVTAWTKLHAPVAPDPAALSLTGLGALAINLSCAILLARHRHHQGSLTRAAFLSRATTPSPMSRSSRRGWSRPSSGIWPGPTSSSASPSPCSTPMRPGRCGKRRARSIAPPPDPQRWPCQWRQYRQLSGRRRPPGTCAPRRPHGDAAPPA